MRSQVSAIRPVTARIGNPRANSRAPRAGRWPRVLLVAFTALAASAPLGCSNCGEGKTSSKLQRQVAPVASEEPSEGRPVAPPELPAGKPIEGDAFKEHVPDAVAGFSAVGPGEASSSPLANGGVLTRFGRNYKRGEQTLRVELSDSLHAPLLSQVIRQRQGTEVKTDKSELVGTAIAGQPAVLMFQTAAQTAYANVLLGERVLLNVQVVPADGVASAVEVASALPLAKLAALVPIAKPGGTALTAEPAPDEKSPAVVHEPAPANSGATKPKPAAPAPKAPRSPN
jgi:hypothetical protein